MLRRKLPNQTVETPRERPRSLGAFSILGVFKHLGDTFLTTRLLRDPLVDPDDELQVGAEVRFGLLLLLGRELRVELRDRRAALLGATVVWAVHPSSSYVPRCDTWQARSSELRVSSP